MIYSSKLPGSLCSILIEDALPRARLKEAKVHSLENGDKVRSDHLYYGSKVHAKEFVEGEKVQTEGIYNKTKVCEKTPDKGATVQSGGLDIEDKVHTEELDPGAVEHADNGSKFKGRRSQVSVIVQYQNYYFTHDNSFTYYRLPINHL